MVWRLWLNWCLFGIAIIISYSYLVLCDVQHLSCHSCHFALSASWRFLGILDADYTTLYLQGNQGHLGWSLWTAYTRHFRVGPILRVCESSFCAALLCCVHAVSSCGTAVSDCSLWGNRCNGHAALVTCFSKAFYIRYSGSHL